MKIILITIFLFASLTLAQNTTKYFIYFKDKGINKINQLSKSSIEYNQAINSLSERSIKRRVKTFGENIITFEDVPIKPEYVESINKSGAKIVWKLKWFNAVSAYLTENQFEKISNYIFVDKIEKVKTIDYKRDEKLEAKLGKTSNVSDSEYKLNYGPSLNQVELSDVPIIHDAGFSGEGVLVGILDAGFAWQNHPALQDRDILAERDFVNGDDSTDDGDASHGTAVFSLIGGFDEGQIIGPAYNSQYVLAKTEDVSSETHVEEDNYVAAMEWMDSIGVDITTTSLGYSEFNEGEGDYTYADMDGKTTIVTRASELAFARGILTINSVGNEGNTSWKYMTAPADGFNTIAVGAVGSSGNIASFSSVGPTFDKRIKPDVVARGVSCYAARAYVDTLQYSYGSGTSFSAPIVSGIAAQLLSAFPYLTNDQMRTIIVEAGDRTNNPNNQYGYGLLSSKRAFEFPNVSYDSEIDNYFINKAIIDSNGILDGSLNLFYSINSDEIFYKSTMEKLSANIYQTKINANWGDVINFYFEYTSSNKIKKRVPESDNYKLIYGTSDVTLNYSTPIYPFEIDLSQNFPNPFRSSTSIVIYSPRGTKLSVSIYNILGQTIAKLYSGLSEKEFTEVTWNGLDDFGSRVSSGVYIYRVISNDNSISKKMIYLK